ncbi:MAG: extracellular solute-binding protein [Roseiflexaceae bacterium]|nr:extracellular solute-binding protein [Roseiflexaceae bacterium]
MADQQIASRSRRAFLQSAASLGAAAVLAACSGTPAQPAQPTQGTQAAQPTSPPQAPAQPSKVSGTITWYMNIDAVRNKWAQDVIIPAFAKEQPNITVTLMTVPWEEFDSKLLALAAAGTPPDVFAQWGQSGGGTYFHKNLLYPIDDLIQSRGWDLSGIPPLLQRAYTFEGKIYGVPMYSLGSFIFYNKKLFDEAKVAYPPTDWNDQSWTWDEMLNRAKALTKDYGDREKGQYGFANAINDLYGGIPWLFGAEIFSKDSYDKAKITAVEFTDPKMIAAVQAKADLVTKHKISPTPAISDTISQGGGLLGSGKVAMIYGGGWEIWPLKDLKELQWGIAAVPRQETNRIPTFSDPWYIAKGSKNVDASFAFVQYLTTGAGQQSMALALQAPPAVQSLLPEWYKNFPTVESGALEKVYKGAIANAKETPASLLFGYGPVEDAYNQMLAPVWNGEKSAAEVIPQLQDRATEAIKNL